MSDVAQHDHGTPQHHHDAAEHDHTPSSTVHHDNGYSVKDIIMWRKKRMSLGVVAAATLFWVVMEVYSFNFLTVASWVAMFLFSSLFAWANIYRIIYKEEPRMSGLGISESTANRMVNRIRETSEEGMRWIFKVGAQSEWYVFAGTVVGLWILSKIGELTDLVTLIFIGTIVGMTLPVIWHKYDYKIREHGKRLQMQSKRFYSKIDERVVQKIKNKLGANSARVEIKEKKAE